MTNAERPIITSVISISDGDTLRVDTTNKLRKFYNDKGVNPGRTTSVRFFGIDAPEKDQPFGELARDMIVRSVPVYSQVNLYPRDIDRYGRLVAEVSVGDGAMYEHILNTYLLSMGLAVGYRKWLTKAGKRDLYLPLEAEARKKKINIWGDKEFVMPSVWRRNKRIAAKARKEIRIDQKVDSLALERP